MRLFAGFSHAALTLLCVLALVVLLAVGLSKPLGYRLLVDYSDSMQPAIAAGDVVVTRLVPAARAEEGDVVSFQDPDRQGRLLTHRVVRRRERPGEYDFVTRGDANTGVERWSIDDGGTLGVMVGRVPRIGYVLSWMQGTIVALIVVLGAGVLLGALLIRRVVRL